MEIQDLAGQYQSRTDEELLRLALDAEQLTPEANAVLNDELARRRINSVERLSAFREQEEQRKEDSAAVPAEVSGWLLVLCLILTFVYPATSLYQIFSHTIPSAIAARALNQILLLSVYSLVFITVSLLSFVAGVRLWLVKPNAVRFARRYLLTYLIANIAYFVFWIIVMQPTKQGAFVYMGWYHIGGPATSFALWYSYLERSKRVRATYPAL